jgi:hypothetical protein
MMPAGAESNISKTNGISTAGRVLLRWFVTAESTGLTGRSVCIESVPFKDQ